MAKIEKLKAQLAKDAREIVELEGIIARLEGEYALAKSQEDESRTARLLGRVFGDGGIGTATAKSTDLYRDLESASQALGIATARHTTSAQAVYDAELLALDSRGEELDKLDGQRKQKVARAFAVLYVELARDGKSLGYHPKSPYDSLLSLVRVLDTGRCAGEYAQAFGPEIDRILTQELGPNAGIDRHPADLDESPKKQRREISDTRTALTRKGAVAIATEALSLARNEK